MRNLYNLSTSYLFRIYTKVSPRPAMAFIAVLLFTFFAGVNQLNGQTTTEIVAEADSEIWTDHLNGNHQCTIEDGKNRWQ
jgi:hypothetical protein